jgi:hypothetical protein
MNERFQASRARFEAEQREAGRVDGTKWAADEAENEELRISQPNSGCTE